MNVQLKQNLVAKIHNQLKKFHKELSKMEPVNLYLVKQLESYANCLKHAHTKTEVEKCSKLFSRFCTESLDWETPEYKECIELSEEGYRVAK